MKGRVDATTGENETGPMTGEVGAEAANASATVMGAAVIERVATMVDQEKAKINAAAAAAAAAAAQAVSAAAARAGTGTETGVTARRLRPRRILAYRSWRRDWTPRTDSITPNNLFRNSTAVRKSGTRQAVAGSGTQSSAKCARRYSVDNAVSRYLFFLAR